MSDIELNFEGELNDSLKREIDYLIDQGFDPEKELQKERAAQLEAERQMNLILPESCIPTIGDVDVAPGDGNFKAPIADVESYLEKLILSLPPSSTFMLDFRDRSYLIGAEIVLGRLKGYLADNYIRCLLTPEMKEAVRQEQQKSWEAKARKN